MTVSIESTGRKYHGSMAANYEAKRKKQLRWDLENDHVRKLLRRLAPSSVLDVPVGTGRFLDVYADLKVKRVIGVDISDTMLAIAEQKRKKIKKIKISLICGDAQKLTLDHVDVAVCVRFLDLIDEAAMRRVMAMLFRQSKRAIICTIRFGASYKPKSNTAEHDERKFNQLVRKAGWRITKRIPVFTQGWHILCITRK